MTQRRHHYESAFEDYLRTRRVPYVAVDEAKKALLPEGEAARLSVRAGDGSAHSIKSFDFVIYGRGVNLLIEIKGRRLGRATLAAARRLESSAQSAAWDGHATPRVRRPRLENWVTQDDVDSLRAWERLFGEGFEAAFVFVYWCDEQPADALFEEMFEHRGRWYALRSVSVGDYAKSMKVRSPRWRTLHLASATFDRISRPFAPGAGSASPLAAHAALSLDLPALHPLDL